MKELSLHILDIARNSINAGANLIEISINEQIDANYFEFIVKDNGHGMNAETLEKLANPFFTTGNKKTGLGIPLLQQHAEAAEGKVEISSELNKGTTIKARFEYNHIDRQPMGDLTGTLTGLIRSHPNIDWVYVHRIGAKSFKLDLRDVRKELDEVPLDQPEVIEFLKSMIYENVKEL